MSAARPHPNALVWLLLSAAIGAEREIRGKDAGLRTYTLVGLGAALFTLFSKYGFNDMLGTGIAVLDPSRVAAQIVSGVGFLGAGMIFVKRDSVRGLTTAAGVWITAAVGATAASGLALLAVGATAAYLIVIAAAFPALARRLPRPASDASALRIRYPDGRGILRLLLQTATAEGFTIDEVSAQTLDRLTDAPHAELGGGAMVEVRLSVHGRSPVSELAAALSEIDDVDAVLTGTAGRLRA